MGKRLQEVSFVGALSFEDRCVGALHGLGSRGRRLNGVIFDYGSEATPGSEAAEMRQRSWGRVSALCSQYDWNLERVSVNPYSVGDVRTLIEALAVPEQGRLVVDITCMTKAHVLGAATALAGEDRDWAVSYSKPQVYGSVGTSHQAGWRGTLTLALGRDPSFHNQGLALGLLIPGAEVERAYIALEEIESSAGVIASVKSQSRPDLHLATAAGNRNLYDYLGKQRLAGPKVEESGFIDVWGARSWVHRDIRETRVASDIFTTVGHLVESAKMLGGPIVLYPMGPKDAVFTAGLALSMLYEEASWAVYPVLVSHPLDYSEGVRAVQWVTRDEFEKVRPR